MNFSSDDSFEDIENYYRKKQVPLFAKGRLFPSFPIHIVQYTDGRAWNIDVNDAYRAMVCGTDFLRSLGVLLPRERIRRPIVCETHIAYDTTRDAEEPLRQSVLDEIPVGRQRIVEKRALTKLGRPLPEELVDLLHDFVWPVDRRHTSKKDIGE